MELTVGAAVSRRGEGSASQIYDEILSVGDRAYLANVYATTERLTEKGILLCRQERRVTADGVEREVRIYELTDLGREKVAAAVKDAQREVELLQLTPRHIFSIFARGQTT